MTDATAASIGFSPDEVDTSAPTRSARLKWVVVVNDSIPAGRAVNAAVCVAAATAVEVGGLLGPTGVDASGSVHAGLPWAGCSVLSADTVTLRAIRAQASSHEATFVADMPAAAQQLRVYDDYLGAIGETEHEEIDYLAVSIVGPKNRVDRMVGRLPLMP